MKYSDARYPVIQNMLDGGIVVLKYFEKYYLLKRHIREHRIVGQAADIYIHVIRYSCLSRYVRKVLHTATEAAFLLIAVYLLCTGLLYLSYMMWELYQQTPMGRKFVDAFDHKAQLIDTIMGLNFWRFALDVTFSAFVICIGVSAGAWFLHIGRTLYLSLGAVAKLLFWGFPLSAMVAVFHFGDAFFASQREVFMIAAVPTLCLFSSCFRYTEKLVPECGDVLREGMRLAKEYAAYLQDKIR